MYICRGCLDVGKTEADATYQDLHYTDDDEGNLYCEACYNRYERKRRRVPGPEVRLRMREAARTLAALSMRRGEPSSYRKELRNLWRIYGFKTASAH